MKIAIVGTGAMGSVYAGLLGRAGHEVWAIDIWKEHVDAIASSGLTVSGASGNFVVDNLHVGRAPRDAGRCNLWVIATKASEVEAAAAAIAPLLEPDSVVMALQNGLGAGERVARHIPPEHIVIGIAEGFGSSIPEPGHVHHEGMRLIRIGELHGGITDRLQRTEQTWRDAGFNVRAFADVSLMIWEKFLCNVTLSAPCAVFDVTVGELMSNRGGLEGRARLHRRGLPARSRQGGRLSLRRPVAVRDRLRRHDPQRQPVDASRPPRPTALRDRRHQRAGGHSEPGARARGSVQRGPLRRPAPSRVAVRRGGV